MIDSIISALKQNAAQKPDKVAIIADDVRITYAELWREVQGFAAYIRSLNLEAGSRVVVKVAQSIWFAVSAFGIQLSGNIHVALEKNIGPDGLDKVANELGASLIISNIPSRTGLPRIDSDEVRQIARAHYTEGLDFPLPDPGQICDILFTTGTTGKPKGVMLSHGNVLAVAQNALYGAEITEDNVYLCPSPINHASGMRKVYVTMLAGSSLVLMDGFTNVKKFYACIHDYGVTALVMPPSAVRMLLMLSANEMAKCADQIQHVITGSAPFPEVDKEKLCELLPKSRLYIAYGSSESGYVLTYDYAKYRGLLNCVGRATKNARVFIVDDDHHEIQSSPNHLGLIACQGPMTMQGYFNDPELTKGCKDGDILYTNDIGYIDGDGFVFVQGRKDDVINIGGLKIAPTEVEGVALRYPGVSECVCYAVQDRMGGNVPRLNVVPEEGVELDLKALRAHLARQLEAFKVPKQIEVVDAIPKTANGKIDRKALR